MVDERTTSTDAGKWIGTFDYMSPEQLRGESADTQSDVYSLGCLLYACLAGSPPFHRDTTAATITAHLHEDPPSVSDVPGVPRAFDAVISRSLAKRSRDRFRDAGALGAAALVAAQGGRRGRWRRAWPGVAVASPASARGPVLSPGTEKTRVADRTRATVVGGDAETKWARTAVMPAPADETNRLRAADAGRRRWLGRPRRVGVALIAGLVAAAAVAALIVSTGQQPPPAGPLTGAQISAAVHGFADDYSHHDVRALSHLLAADVSRVDPSSAQHGRPAVLREYESQFATRPVPTSYALHDVKVTSGWAGRAEAEYTLTVVGGGHLSGHVVFGLQRTGNRVQVALISTQ